MSAYSDLILGTTGIVAYWRLGQASGTSGAGSVVDATGNGINGTPTSITFGSGGAIAGDSDTAATFGSGSNVDVAYTAAMAVTTGYTLECWLYLDSLRNYNAAITRTNGGTPEPYELWIGASGEANFFHRYNSGGASYYNVAAPNGTFTAGAWQHVACVWNGVDIRLYRNGVLVGSPVAVTTVYDTGLALKLGSRAGGGTQLNGRMDEAAIYNRALSSTEIANHYAVGTTTPTVISRTLSSAIIGGAL